LLSMPFTVLMLATMTIKHSYLIRLQSTGVNTQVKVNCQVLTYTIYYSIVLLRHIYIGLQGEERRIAAPQL